MQYTLTTKSEAVICIGNTNCLSCIKVYEFVQVFIANMKKTYRITTQAI